jgi:hypothetical protein
MGIIIACEYINKKYENLVAGNSSSFKVEKRSVQTGKATLIEIIELIL